MFLSPYVFAMRFVAMVRDLVRGIMELYSTTSGFIDMREKRFKSIIYDKVIAKLKEKKYYFEKLNLNIIMKQVNSLKKDGFFFGEGSSVLS